MLRGHRDLKVFQLAYRLAMEIFQLSKSFPREEVYSLTDQIRRSSAERGREPGRRISQAALPEYACK